MEYLSSFLKSSHKLSYRSSIAPNKPKYFRGGTPLPHENLSGSTHWGKWWNCEKKYRPNSISGHYSNSASDHSLESFDVVKKQCRGCCVKGCLLCRPLRQCWQLGPITAWDLLISETATMVYERFLQALILGNVIFESNLNRTTKMFWRLDVLRGLLPR